MRKSKIGFIREEVFWKEIEIGDEVLYQLYFGYNKQLGWRELTLIKKDGEIKFLGKKYKDIDEAKEAAIKNTSHRYWARKKLEEEYFSNGS